MSLDQIAVTGLRVFGRHGVLPEELTDGQEFIIDAELAVDTVAAGAADDLTLTVDYGELTGQLAAIVAGEPVALIETLAARLAAACLACSPVAEVRITVHKPHAPVPETVSDITMTIVRRRAVLGLGSNLGDRLATLQAGLDVLGAQPGLERLSVSPVYETEPVGGPAQDDYLNAVVTLSTGLPGSVLLACARAAEDAMGRVREERWGPRTLDVDVIMAGAERSGAAELTLPHPRAHERAFVLAPWLDLDPGAVLPGYGPVAGLLAAAGRDGIRPRPDLTLRLPAAVEPPA
jgi:dihydroneopterin aldolase/2-amino-4-hydroxy-6-hydroxymethyldihydropteridine diphosphokinase